MAIHAVEVRSDVHAAAKKAAADEGITLDAYLSRAITEYGAEPYKPIARKPRSERDIVRVKLGIDEQAWQAASRRAKDQATSVTIALMDRLVYENAEPE